MDLGTGVQKFADWVPQALDGGCTGRLTRHRANFRITRAGEPRSVRSIDSLGRSCEMKKKVSRSEEQKWKS